MIVKFICLHVTPMADLARYLRTELTSTPWTPRPFPSLRTVTTYGEYRRPERPLDVLETESITSIPFIWRLQR